MLCPECRPRNIARKEFEFSIFTTIIFHGVPFGELLKNSPAIQILERYTTLPVCRHRRSECVGLIGASASVWDLAALSVTRRMSLSPEPELQAKNGYTGAMSAAEEAPEWLQVRVAAHKRFMTKRWNLRQQ